LDSRFGRFGSKNSAPSRDFSAVGLPTAAALAMSRRKPSFALQAAPFMLLMAAGSWGLGQFLKLPVQVKDDRARRRREGRQKFNLEKEQEVLATPLSSRCTRGSTRPATAADACLSPPCRNSWPRYRRRARRMKTSESLVRAIRTGRLPTREAGHRCSVRRGAALFVLLPWRHATAAETAFATGYGSKTALRT